MGSARQALPVHAMVMTSPTGFSELYEQHHATVDRIVLRVIGNPADGEECDDDGETEHPQNPDHFRGKG
jgi:DNA-directed RNA polymerase specialized sigma24 family protein